MKTEYGWPPTSWRMLYGVVMVFLVCAGLFACAADGTLPGSDSNSADTTNNSTINIFINNIVNGEPGAGAPADYIKLTVTQQDNLNYLIEWETLGALAAVAPSLAYDFYIDGEVEVTALTGRMYIWTAENIDGLYIFKMCLAGISAAFCSDEKQVDVTAVEEVAEESG